MALGSKKRDYKTEDRNVREILAVHYKLMKQYMSEGMSKEEASKRAYRDMRKK